MRDPNRIALEKIADALGSMNQEVVYVGGAIVGLLITDPASPTVRVTDDVDCIIEVVSRSEYDHRIRGQLLERGFAELVGDGIPICAWQKDGIRVDVMPTEESILGFSSSWYQAALDSARHYDLNMATIRVIDPALFLATKLEAFHSRGRGDYLFSHDMEDIAAIVDGRESIAEDVRQCIPSVQNYLTGQFQALLADSHFTDDVARLIPDRSRQSIVLDRMSAIASIRED
jgi:hypothetical protein